MLSDCPIRTSRLINLLTILGFRCIRWVYGIPVKGSTYGNLVLGNEDKLMISFHRDLSHNYSMDGACSVLYKGEMHFFGGPSKDEFLSGFGGSQTLFLK